MQIQKLPDCKLGFTFAPFSKFSKTVGVLPSDYAALVAGPSDYALVSSVLLF